jgi:hypothetical protein
MPFTRAHVEDVAENGNFPLFIFDWMESSTPWKARSRAKQPAETWLLLVRGGRNIAFSLAEPQSNENVGWGICGDGVLSALLAAAGLEANRCLLYRAANLCTADARTGTVAHELLHAAVGAEHEEPPDDLWCFFIPTVYCASYTVRIPN